MDMQALEVGDRIRQAPYGPGTVTFVGADYVGITLDAGGDVLVRKDAANRTAAGATPAEDRRETLPWPASTFVHEQGEGPHAMGAHWQALAVEPQDILARLPEILPQALLQTGYGEHFNPPSAIPVDWPTGFQLVWPLRMQGLGVVVGVEAGANFVATLFPFFAGGSQHTLVLRRVSVWRGGLEAQITADWGNATVSFFDAQYLINRGWYETGRAYDFILTGVAYEAAPTEKRELTFNRHPDEVAWMNLRVKEGDDPHESTCTVTFDGAALFLPVDGWDVDDYEFHGPVKSVTPFSDWLGQDGWRVRTTVMRWGDEGVDLDIVITRHAWSGKAPPRVGQDIEGRLWLQGYLWMVAKDERKTA